MTALIEGAGAVRGVACDLSPGKIGAYALMAVEGEGQLWYTSCQVADAQTVCWTLGNPTIMRTLDHPYLPSRKIDEQFRLCAGRCCREDRGYSALRDQFEAGLQV